jgi:hypothetical protein
MPDDTERSYIRKKIELASLLLKINPNGPISETVRAVDNRSINVALNAGFQEGIWEHRVFLKMKL